MAGVGEADCPRMLSTAAVGVIRRLPVASPRLTGPGEQPHPHGLYHEQGVAFGFPIQARGQVGIKFLPGHLRRQRRRPGLVQRTQFDLGQLSALA